MKEPIKLLMQHMSHCQICLCPSPNHAVNCPVATGEPVTGSVYHHQWQQGQRQHDPLELRIEWLEKEVQLLRGRIAQLEIGNVEKNL